MQTHSEYLLIGRFSLWEFLVTTRGGNFPGTVRVSTVGVGPPQRHHAFGALCHMVL